MWVLWAFVCCRWVSVGHIWHIHIKLTTLIGILITLTFQMVWCYTGLFIWYLTILNAYIESSLQLLIILRLYLCIIIFISAFDSFHVCNLATIVASPDIFKRYVLLIPLLMCSLISVILNKGSHLCLALFIWIVETIEGVGSG